MLRRSTASLFRRTPANRSGGHAPHIQTPEEAPPANDCLGLFGKLNGSLSMLRPLDIKWIMNRCVGLGREGNIASPVLYGMIWAMIWKAPQSLLHGDGAPPRSVDWNKGTAGSLPSGFEKTQL